MSRDSNQVQAASHFTPDGMSYQAAAEFIFEFECKHDLLKFQFDGWCIWPLFRYAAQLHLQQFKCNSLRGLSRIQRLFSAAAMLPKLAFLPASSHLVFTASTARSELVNGLYEDVFFDEMLVGASNFFKVELVNNIEFYKRGRTARIKTDLTTAPLDFLVSILNRMRRVPEVQDAAAKIASELVRETRFALFTEDVIAERLREFYWNKRVMKWFLSKLAVKKVIILDAAFKPGLLCAARELGVETFDQQHGINDRVHCQYAWTDYAKSFKPKLPLPDKLLLYGEFWKDELLRHDFWSDSQLLVTGGMRIDRYRRLKSRVQRDDRKVILVTTQGIDRERLIAFLIDFAQRIENSNIELVVKLHPGFDVSRQPYELLASRKNVRVIGGAEWPSTFELLIKATGHVSISSACHFEAVGLGIPTFVLQLNTHETMQPLLERGDAMVVSSAEELLQCIQNNKFTRVIDKTSEFYFRPNAVTNISEAIDLHRTMHAVQSIESFQ